MSKTAWTPELAAEFKDSMRDAHRRGMRLRRLFDASFDARAQARIVSRASTARMNVALPLFLAAALTARFSLLAFGALFLMAGFALMPDVWSSLARTPGLRRLRAVRRAGRLQWGAEMLGSLPTGSGDLSSDEALIDGLVARAA